MCVNLRTTITSLKMYTILKQCFPVDVLRCQLIGKTLLSIKKQPTSLNQYPDKAKCKRRLQIQSLEMFMQP